MNIDFYPGTTNGWKLKIGWKIAARGRLLDPGIGARLPGRCELLVSRSLNKTSTQFYISKCRQLKQSKVVTSVISLESSPPLSQSMGFRYEVAWKRHVLGEELGKEKTTHEPGSINWGWSSHMKIGNASNNRYTYM